MHLLPLLLWNLGNMEHLRTMEDDQTFVEGLPRIKEMTFPYFPYPYNFYKSYDPTFGREMDFFAARDYLPRRMYPHTVFDDTVSIDDKDNFKVVINLQQFKPEEISVKVVDRWVIVKANHEEKRGEHGSVSRHFVRKYLLPDRADADQVTSTISNDGVLTIIAPLKPEEPKHEREIKIELTGQPHIHSRGDNKDEAGTIASTEKKVEENEIREEMTTQAQEEKAKPEK